MAQKRLGFKIAEDSFKKNNGMNENYQQQNLHLRGNPTEKLAVSTSSKSGHPVQKALSKAQLLKSARDLLPLPFQLIQLCAQDMELPKQVYFFTLL